MGSQGVFASFLQVVPSYCQEKPQLPFALTQVNVASCDSADLKFPPPSLLTFMLTCHIQLSSTPKGHWGFQQLQQLMSPITDPVLIPSSVQDLHLEFVYLM